MSWFKHHSLAIALTSYIGHDTMIGTPRVHIESVDLLMDASKLAFNYAVSYVKEAYLAFIRRLAHAWPTTPHTIPAVLYSPNLTTKQKSRWNRVYLGSPAVFGSKTALGVRASSFLKPAQHQD